MKKIIKENFIKIIILIVCISILIISSILQNNMLSKEANKESELDNKIMDISFCKKHITNREIMYLNQKLYIGKNEKEIQNDFYDILIEIKDNALKVNINKLIKEDVSEEIANDSYIYELANLINNLYDLNFDTTELDTLKYYIEDEYINLRSMENDYNIGTNLIDETAIKDNNIKLEIDNNMLVLTISKKEV